MSTEISPSLNLLIEIAKAEQWGQVPTGTTGRVKALIDVADAARDHITALTPAGPGLVLLPPGLQPLGRAIRALHEAEK